MNQVDFYLISNSVTHAKYKLASRLANKLQRNAQSSLLITDDNEATTELNKVMWSFSDTSFLPHDHLSDASGNSNVRIAEHNSISQAALEKNFDVLINLSTDVPMFNQNFSRIAEIVEQDDESKAAARSRYKRYQAEGYDLKMHNIEL